MFCVMFSASGITGYRNQQETTKYFADSAPGGSFKVEYLLNFTWKAGGIGEY